MELRQLLAKGRLGLRGELRLLPKILLRQQLLRERKRLLAKVLLRQCLAQSGRRRHRQSRIRVIKERLIVELWLGLKDLPLLPENIACLLRMCGSDNTSER